MAGEIALGIILVGGGLFVVIAILSWLASMYRFDH